MTEDEKMTYKNHSTAKTHIVDATGGGDFPTIQAAINAAFQGDSIYITPGVYEEDLIFPSLHSLDYIRDWTGPLKPFVS